MKNKVLTVISILAICLSTACYSGSSSKHGKDTAQQHYDAPSNIDTSKITTTTGSASDIDEGASGGTNTVKGALNKKQTDSAKKQSGH